MNLRNRLLTGLLALLAGAAAQAEVIKIATTAPDGTAWMREMRAGADAVKTRTEGRVELKYYPGGVMGDQGVSLSQERHREQNRSQESRHCQLRGKGCGCKRREPAVRVRPDALSRARIAWRGRWAGVVAHLPPDRSPVMFRAAFVRDPNAVWQ